MRGNRIRKRRASCMIYWRTVTDCPSSAQKKSEAITEAAKGTMWTKGIQFNPVRFWIYASYIRIHIGTRSPLLLYRYKVILHIHNIEIATGGEKRVALAFVVFKTVLSLTASRRPLYVRINRKYGILLFDYAIYLNLIPFCWAFILWSNWLSIFSLCCRTCRVRHFVPSPFFCNSTSRESHRLASTSSATWDKSWVKDTTPKSVVIVLPTTH